MRVVVVGASGNVGTSVIEALAEDGAVTSMLGLARRRPDWHPAKTTWAAADIAEDDLLPHFTGADAVVHLAWLLQPTHDMAVTWRNNVLGSERVFRAVAAAGVRTLVYASSVCAYCPAPRNHPVAENWPTHGWPTAPYTREKAYVERLLDTFERECRDVRVVRFRPGFMFKRESAAQLRRQFVGPLLPASLARPKLVPVFPDLPDLLFQALHSRDAGQAFRLAVTGDARGAFNLAAEPVINARRLAALLAARPIHLPTAAVRAAFATAWHLRLLAASPQLFDAVLHAPLMDATRARTVLGWQPTYSGLEAIGDLFAGLRAAARVQTPPLAVPTSHLLGGARTAIAKPAAVRVE